MLLLKGEIFFPGKPNSKNKLFYKQKETLFLKEKKNEKISFHKKEIFINLKMKMEIETLLEVKDIGKKTVGTKTLITFDGHTFYKNQENLFLCSGYKKHGCNVYVTFENDRYYYCDSNIHNHEIEKLYDEREFMEQGISKIVEDIGKKRINVTEEATSIYTQIKDPHISFNSFRQKIYNRIREEKETMIEEVSKEGLNYKLFEEEDYVIYGDDENINHFEESPILFMDGTFKICPSLFNNINIISTNQQSIGINSIA